MTTDRNAVILTQALILHGYNLFIAGLIASVHGARWAVPQIVLALVAIMFGGTWR